MEDLLIKKIDELSSMMIDDIKKIVQIDSIESQALPDAPFGKGIKQALDQTLKIAQRLGFETENLDNYIGYCQYGQGDDYVCAIGHLDVVCTGEGWKHPPFSGYEENGYIYSRGILDNKGPIMACLYALKAIKELDISIKYPIRIIFGCDEESGFEDLKYYLSKEKPPLMGFTPDCKYPVVYGERGRAVIEIRERNIDQFNQMVNTYFLNAKNNGETLGLDYQDEEFGMSEIRCYHLKYENDKYVFSFTLSYPAGMDIKKAIAQIKEKTGMEVELISHFYPVKFEKDCFMVKQMQKAYEKITHLDGTPVTTTGGTYAKLMPHIVPFGPSFPGQKGIGHLPNEWMKIDDIIDNAKIYALALYYLTKGEG
ncbi:MAG: Sapep family Mn(2+)-dependent dipeptidase [Faecalibacillus sp.]